MPARRRLVAVFEISEDANEDRWAEVLWRAELAAREAATEPGYDADDLTVTQRHQGYIVVSRPDGLEFEARITTNPKLPGYALPVRHDPPTE